MAKVRQEKNKTIVYHRTCFSPSLSSCMGASCFSQQPAINSFLMEEKIHDGSSISRRRPLLLCCNSGTVI
jgi:hypothetical protein